MNTNGLPVYVELPSAEHPTLIAAALDEAEARGVRIHRFSQGGGSRFLLPSELEEMLGLAHGHGAQLFTFVSSRNSFEGLVDTSASDQVRGEDAFHDAVDELYDCAAAGIDGVLIADLGLLRSAGRLRRAGKLGELQLKSAAAIGPHNAAMALLLEELGATSINAPPSVSIAGLRAMRSVLSDKTTLDVYVEAPYEMGGGLRYRDLAALAQQAPLHLKFGLRNAPSLYPYGSHLEPLAERSIREKVRRIEIVVRQLQRVGLDVSNLVNGERSVAGAAADKRADAALVGHDVSSNEQSVR
jgi:hypothetical protein